MKKFLFFVFVLVLSAGISTAAIIDMGGDLQLRTINRNNFDLIGLSATENWVDSYLRVYMNARPYPDVRAYVRLIGEKDWGSEDVVGESTAGIDIDLAYVELENIWASRASVTAGRQELLYGEGFVVGRNPSYRTATYERSPRKAFDALKLSYDLAPFTLDFFGSIIDEGYGEESMSLFGTNLRYDYLNTASLDIGAFYKDSDDRSNTLAFSVRGESDIGKFPGLRVKAEVVPQVGKYNEFRDLSALGMYGGVRYLFAHERMSCVPHYVHVNYYYLSGDDGLDDFGGFDPMFNDMFFGEVNAVNPALGIDSNARILNFGFGWHISPAVDLGVELYQFKRDEPVFGSLTDIGTEADIYLTYRYNPGTELVLTWGYFSPEPLFAEKNAMQITAALKLDF